MLKILNMKIINCRKPCMVGLSGLEPPTSRLSGVRSNQLSYKPINPAFLTSTLWWRWGGSNSWPPACKAGALPAELHPQLKDLSAPLNSHIIYEGQNRPSKLNNITIRWKEIPIALKIFKIRKNMKIKINKLKTLHRKEVIQPHLPIRLPCYDFTPVINPTFGSVLFR